MSLLDRLLFWRHPPAPLPPAGGTPEADHQRAEAAIRAAEAELRRLRRELEYEQHWLRLAAHDRADADDQSS